MAYSLHNPVDCKLCGGIRTMVDIKEYKFRKNVLGG